MSQVQNLAANVDFTNSNIMIIKKEDFALYMDLN
jgi:hypothetical protein